MKDPQQMETLARQAQAERETGILCAGALGDDAEASAYLGGVQDALSWALGKEHGGALHSVLDRVTPSMFDAPALAVATYRVNRPHEPADDDKG